MKKLKKVIIWFLAVFLVIFLISAIAIAIYGKKIVESKIQQSLKVKASLGGISLSMPFSLHMNKLEIGDLLSAEKISATPSILGFFAGKLVLSGLTVVNPVINLEESSDGRLNLPKLEQKEKQPPFYLTGLVIKNGKIKFSDKKITPEGFEIMIDKVDASISKVMLPPTSLNAKFKVTAAFLSPKEKSLGSVGAEGWIDYRHKDMDATFELKDFDASYFQPYFGDFISSRKILSAKVNFLSHLRAENNNLTIDSNLRLSNLVYAQAEAPKEAGPSEEGGAPKEAVMPDINIVSNALDLFTDKDGNLNLDFALKTKLDNPQISIEQLKKAIVEAALRNLARQSPESIFEKVNKNIGKFKDIGKEFKKIFKNK